MSLRELLVIVVGYLIFRTAVNCVILCSFTLQLSVVGFRNFTVEKLQAFILVTPDDGPVVPRVRVGHCALFNQYDELMYS